MSELQAKRIAELETEVRAWKPDFAYQGHACPNCGRKYGNAEKDQLEMRIAELETQRDRAVDLLIESIKIVKEE